MPDLQEQEDAPPDPPRRPDDEDCCRGGCSRCIFDIYVDALAQYRIRYAAWQARAQAMPHDYE